MNFRSERVSTSPLISTVFITTIWLFGSTKMIGATTTLRVSASF
jgi:hypothetical protein